MTIGLVIGKGATTSGLAASSGLLSLVLNVSVKGFSEAAVTDDKLCIYKWLGNINGYCTYTKISFEEHDFELSHVLKIISHTKNLFQFDSVKYGLFD